MRSNRKLTLALLAAICAATLTIPAAVADDLAATTDANIDALMRGPVHEAFLEQVNLDPQPGQLVTAVPPQPIEEIPPQVRPAGDNVLWIPGYWAWDFVLGEYIWISGGWRLPPPNMRWVPGYWMEASEGTREGYIRVSGYWEAANNESITYYPPPPRSLERGATSDPPSGDYFWTCGSWTYHEGRYKWRPGHWTPYQRGWVWIPDRYLWTPRGHIYRQGYWDHDVEARGHLFAPVRFTADVYRQDGFRYGPSVSVSLGGLQFHLFVNARQNHYVFGDYYGEQYVDAGIYPWFHKQRHLRGYDPLFSYQHWSHRKRGDNYLADLTAWHTYVLEHPDFRPRHTFDEQHKFLEAHAGHKYLSRATVGQTLDDAIRTAETGTIVHLDAAKHLKLTKTARELQRLSERRTQTEVTSGIDLADKRVLKDVVKTPVRGLTLPTSATSKIAPSAHGALRVPATPRSLVDGAAKVIDPAPAKRNPKPAVQPPVRLPVQPPVRKPLRPPARPPLKLPGLRF